ncbi:SAG family member [Eimeria mitis]|uniref:SAG family member n=1 Tax=Eimeria mitis TaxID=44415 RepID=U6K550_9EIME|nr:SAG family member [Eimeria mitis]CDJ31457.1 SAG family member [Eimeria mitis]
MRKLTSVLISAAVLGAAHQVEGSDSNEKGSAASVDCLADFNAARERAGLEAFTEEKEEGKKLPTGEEDYIAAICSAIQEASGLYFPYHFPVSYWKGAHVNFGDLPPEYNADSAVYKDSRNLSLVALYNPQDGATVDCAYITCPVSTTTTTTVASSTGSTDAEEEEETTPNKESTFSLIGERDAGGSSSSGDQPKTGPSVRRLSTPSQTVTGLVCLTNPAALENGKKPFSLLRWLLPSLVHISQKLAFHLLSALPLSGSVAPELY